MSNYCECNVVCTPTVVYCRCIFSSGMVRYGDTAAYGVKTLVVILYGIIQG